MKIAIQRQIVSPESEFIASVLKDADVYDPWLPHTDIYDVAVCIGPVTSCPPASKRILFVLGQTASHPDLDWDLVVVTSNKARKLALRKFGHGIRTMKLVPPVLQLEAGRRRLVKEMRGYIHASEVANGYEPGIKMLNLWAALPVPTVAWNHTRSPAWSGRMGSSLFTALEFNSLVRGGAIGFYPKWMEDGYDIQVRRHLALGGRVVCEKNKGILGDSNDLVDDIDAKIPILKLDPKKPTDLEDTESYYACGVKEAIRRA